MRGGPEPVGKGSARFTTAAALKAASLAVSIIRSMLEKFSPSEVDPKLLLTANPRLDPIEVLLLLLFFVFAKPLDTKDDFNWFRGDFVVGVNCAFVSRAVGGVTWLCELCLRWRARARARAGDGVSGVSEGIGTEAGWRYWLLLLLLSLLLLLLLLLTVLLLCRSGGPCPRPFICI